MFSYVPESFCFFCLDNFLNIFKLLILKWWAAERGLASCGVRKRGRGGRMNSWGGAWRCAAEEEKSDWCLCDFCVNFYGGITFVWHAKLMTWGRGGVRRQRLARIWSENRSCSCPKNICDYWDLKCDLELVLIQIVCLVLGTFATRPTCISRRLVPCLSFSSSSGPRQKSPPPTGVPWV